MNIRTHGQESSKIAEVVTDEIIIHTEEDALELLGNLSWQGYDRIILHEKNLAPEFFDLKTRLAGEVLQKFTNYRVRLAIIGEFTKYPGKSIRDFIYESNQGKQTNFLPDVDTALQKLSA